MTERDLMEVREAARVLGVHENTVRRWADRGLISAVRNPSGVRRLRTRDVRALRRRMSASGRPSRSEGSEPESLESIMGHQGLRVSTFGDLKTDIFGSEDELRDFIAAVYAERDAS